MDNIDAALDEIKRKAEVLDADPQKKAEALDTDPQKKANRNNAQEERWKEIATFMEMASRKDVEELTKDLFQELWKTNGDAAATAITAPFLKKIDADKKKNHSFAGTWVDDEFSILTIDDGIRTASFKTVDKFVIVEELKLKSSEAADKLIYTTDDYRRWYGIKNHELTIQLQLEEYDPDNDTIIGTIEIGIGNECNICDNHHCITFKAKRKGNSD